MGEVRHSARKASFIRLGHEQSLLCRIQLDSCPNKRVAKRVQQGVFIKDKRKKTKLVGRWTVSCLRLPHKDTLFGSG
jgi:hypothetical protein